MQLQVITIGVPEFQEIIASATKWGYLQGRTEANMIITPDPEEWLSYAQIAEMTYRNIKTIGAKVKTKDIMCCPYPGNRRMLAIKRKDISRLFER